MARAWITLMRTFTGLLLLLTATGQNIGEKKEMAVRFDVFGPEKPIFAEDGEDVILSCYLKPRISAKHMEIQFNLSAQNSTQVHLYKEGADNSSTQDPQFKGRTFLRTDRIHEGCVDLLIRRVGPKDSGNYTVFIKSKYYFSAFSFSVTVTESLLQKHFCVWERVYAGIVTFVIIAISIYCFRRNFWRKRKPREASKSYQEGKSLLLDQPIDPESQNLQNQMASERSCQQHAMTPFSEVDIVLDNRNPSSKLWVSKDRKSVKLQNNGPDASNPCNEAFANSFVLACEGFKQGKYRWEVKVDCAKLWAVGIALESVSHMSLSRLAPDEGVWAVGLIAGQYQAFTTPVTALSPKDQPEKVEVYLDVDGGQLSFYDSGTKQHIYSHMGQYTDKVLPFFWTMDPNNPVTVCSPAAADNVSA